LGSYWDASGNNVNIDLNNAGAVREGYEKMMAAKARMEREMSAEDLEQSGTYEELKRELQEMTEYYEDLKTTQTAAYEAHKD
jgi:hypothetical protein